MIYYCFLIRFLTLFGMTVIFVRKEKKRGGFAAPLLVGAPHGVPPRKALRPGKLLQLPT